MSISLKRRYEQAFRKGDPLDPETLTRRELWASVLQSEAVADTLLRYSATHPDLWSGSARDVLERLSKLPGVGMGKSYLYVSVMLLVRSYLQEMQVKN